MESCLFFFILMVYIVKFNFQNVFFHTLFHPLPDSYRDLLLISIIFSLCKACGGTLTDSTGSFTSPGHPNVHPHGVNCTWFIRVDPGLVIRLTFNAFTLEGGVACRFDYVEVFDNSTATPDSSLGR